MITIFTIMNINELIILWKLSGVQTTLFSVHTKVKVKA